MITYPRVLKGNEKLTATWLRELIDCIRRITPVAGPGLKSRTGPNGTILSCINRQSVPQAATRDLGCYRIKEMKREGEAVHVFGNPYVMVGGVLEQHEVDTVVEDLLTDAGETAEDNEDAEVDEETGTVKFKLYLALRILAAPPAEDDPETDEDETEDNEARIVAYANFEELTEAQRDATHHTIPLYLLNVTKTEDEESGEVSYGYEIACDFRRGVWAQQWEVFT